MKPSEFLSEPLLQDLPAWQHYSDAIIQARPTSSELRVFSTAGLYVDMTGQRYNSTISKAIKELLKARNFDQKRDILLNGGMANITEKRAAWHTALRKHMPPTTEIAKERSRAIDFVFRADSERKWRSILHIGIGGSDWGVRLLTSAFGYTGKWRDIRIASNIDGHSIEGALSGLNPHETLIVIATKSFKTSETLENAQRALEWLKQAGIENPYNQIIGITANPQAAEQWGLSPSNIFHFWEWVGGRFSIWSSLGISAALSVGNEIIGGIQNGAAVMDQHFATADIDENIPIQMAMAGIANRSLLGFSSLNLSVYDARLNNLIPYIQQLEMESLGKSTAINGQKVTIPTGPTVWGMTGTDGQHTFYQWLHQSIDGAAVDFIACLQADHRWPKHHEQLLANCLAQREALMQGKSFEQSYQECLEAGMPQEEAQYLAKHRTYTGGRPSNLILLETLNPFTLGALLALYEHKVFVQSVIWGINPFDQWGVEFGKVLASHIMDEIHHPDTHHPHDISTQHWIDYLKKQ
ncbi:glucose-6-phosphate isomerase [Basilea psittacipulmonis]|uniref:Glucose-6-phosphate isomerase n=1 Tax=Basilea psittacipulmonis DSM 24701 TaxID=1072685 RepID=A0A077DF93_9BURK|nr:glucose-6-phosphate isomerase [Basilea psittacipulmonis]AIL32077.1 glucose-6-phosphate isomerase [Basilea psittacipulmonis DSM 24701]